MSFDDIDKNKDGVISKDEFISAFSSSNFRRKVNQQQDEMKLKEQKDRDELERNIKTYSHDTAVEHKESDWTSSDYLWKELHASTKSMKNAVDNLELSSQHIVVTLSPEISSFANGDTNTDVNKVSPSSTASTTLRRWKGGSWDKTQHISDAHHRIFSPLHDTAYKAPLVPPPWNQPILLSDVLNQSRSKVPTRATFAVFFFSLLEVSKLTSTFLCIIYMKFIPNAFYKGQSRGKHDSSSTFKTKVINQSNATTIQRVSLDQFDASPISKALVHEITNNIDDGMSILYI